MSTTVDKEAADSLAKAKHFAQQREARLNALQPTYTYKDRLEMMWPKPKDVRVQIRGLL